MKPRNALLLKLACSRYMLSGLLWFSLINAGSIAVLPQSYARCAAQSVAACLTAAAIIWLARRRWVRLYSSQFQKDGRTSKL